MLSLSFLKKSLTLFLLSAACSTVVLAQPVDSNFAVDNIRTSDRPDLRHIEGLADFRAPLRRQPVRWLVGAMLSRSTLSRKYTWTG